MKVKLAQAVKMFFGGSSLEMVYFEAISNALDADATEINIEISIEAPNRYLIINEKLHSAKDCKG